ncbi:hypothetical protein JKP88DRAFT_249465 [Tribonema minus]|uniref:Uncharacterized protein n=1 Tax=Tribonema minus TaxID=303371 RepID=A0A835YTN1_9STRA|nr:hypothetical protein JKP88DRAFT_249465 [Tribonema minus]
MAKVAALRAATSPAAKLQADIDKANAAWTSADSATSMYAMKNDEQLREHTSLLDAARVPDKALGAVKVLDAIKSFYKEHGERFAAIWQHMAEQPRRHLLSAIAPHMPRHPGDKNAGGQRGSSAGISILAPEINQLQLATDPHHLLKLLDYIVTEDLAEQYLADRDMLKPLVAKGVLQMNMQERNKYAFMVGQSYVGQTSQLTSTADAQVRS